MTMQQGKNNGVGQNHHKFEKGLSSASSFGRPSSCYSFRKCCNDPNPNSRHSIVTLSRRTSLLSSKVRRLHHDVFAIGRGGDTGDELQQKLNSILSQRSSSSLTMEQWKELAKKRHYEAIRTAEQDQDSFDQTTTTNANNFDLNQIQLDSYQLDPKCPYDLPDYSELFQTKNSMIYVTRGSNSNSYESSSSNTPMFTADECDQVILKAERHFDQKKHNQKEKWSKLQSGRFEVCGLWIKDVPAVRQWFDHMVQTRILPCLIQLFPEFCDIMDHNDVSQQLSDLVVDNAYLFKYTPETGERTDVHTDSGCLSFTIALNSMEDYEGGGTWFDGLLRGGGDEEGVICMDKGHVTFRPGGIRHRGNAVTKGTRYIIGGFVMKRTRIEYVRMLTLLGTEYLQDQKYDEAIGAFCASIHLNPKFDGAYTNLANALLKSKSGSLEKQEEEARWALQHCVQHINPNNAEAWYSLGMLLLGQLRRNDGGSRKDVEEAEMCFDQCLQLDHHDIEAMVAQSELCSMKHDKIGEEDWLRRVLASTSSNDDVKASAYCNLGVLLGEKEEATEEEIVLYEKALELKPHLFQARYSLGSAHALCGQYEDAVVHFKMAVESVRKEQQAEGEAYVLWKERLIKALTSLYRATVMLVREEQQQKSNKQHQSPNDARDRIVEIVGKENFDMLAAETATGRRRG